MEEEKQPTHQLNDRFSRLMFGDFPFRQEKQTNVAETSSSQQGVDFLQLMQDIDTLVSSFHQLKPFMKTFTSFTDLLKK
ncbi:hypothetical protein PNH38_15425 [Anoxybacillus rupiensis]|uniref:Uncharacterized protein n=1 Tax=Anoxybacteroides rupiense TaxID=311460 RepID=A0ABD5IU61_9BACL|nr:MULTISPECIES: hypothetical protein [Anoxybacillus]MDE8565248.1 hypothetical protein [Anoxybacillus rupiensis]MED5051862.1 hypothetical protein [Anoxybacillus rupiensis]OQM46603.1 hypothetical protein B6A27_05450 [Anoxybacillus sp. UARK-01]QHC03246.1 hypothetical protein GRQ40_04200 [Anoxybacillus sp. PDR2]